MLFRSKYGDWLAAAGYPEDTENFGIKRIDGARMDLSEPNQQRAQQAQQSTRRYRILNHSTQETVDNKTFPTLQSAVEYAQANGYQIGRGYAVEEIPTTRSSQSRDPLPGSTLDLQRQRANAATDNITNPLHQPRSSNQVGQTYEPAHNGEFTGQWLILDPKIGRAHV